MPRTEYKNTHFELVVESVVPLCLLPRAHASEASEKLVHMINRMHDDADVQELRLEEIAPGVVQCTMMHSLGTYMDQESFPNGVESGGVLTWPDVVTEPYPVRLAAKFLVLRNELAGTLKDIGPTLIDIKFI